MLFIKHFYGFILKMNHPELSGTAFTTIYGQKSNNQNMAQQ